MIPLFITISSFGTAGGMDSDWQKFFDAVQRVESGSWTNPSEAVGDRGKSLGPYQISWAYWHDALEYDPSIGGTYKDVKKKWYAEKVIVSFAKRYKSKAANTKDWQTLAKLHNGGPNWRKYPATKTYWAKVKKELTSGSPSQR